MGPLRNLLAVSFARHSHLTSLCSITAISLTIYVNSLPNSFHFDDIHGIVWNPTIRDLKHIPLYFTDPTTFSLAHRNDWRPILQITYAVNYFLAGLNPTLFRVFNLLWHVGSSVLIYLIIKEIGQRFSAKLLHARAVGLIAALFFAVHPGNSEVVNYIWARSSLLASFFYLLAFYCLLRGPWSPQGHGKLAWHISGLTAFVLGLGTKATAITLPAILVFYELLFLSTTATSAAESFCCKRGVLQKYLPVGLIVIAYLMLRIVLIPETFTRIVAPHEITSLTYLFSSFRAWIYYLGLFLWPAPLIANYHGFGWSYSLGDYRVLLSLSLIVTIIGVAWRVRKSEPLVTLSTLWFFIALLPEGSFIPLSEPVNGYRPYLANVGPSVVLSILSLRGGKWLWSKISPNNTPCFWLAYGVGLGLILSLLSIATIERNKDWRDEVSLWSDVLRKEPTNPKAHLALGVHFLDQEDYLKAKQLFEKAIRLAPQNSYGYMLRGYLNFVLDRDRAALTDFTTAIYLEPRSAYNYFYRAELYRKMGDYDGALADYRRALAMKPHLSDAHFGIGIAQREKGEMAAAMEACKKVIAIDSGDARGYSCVGDLFMDQGEILEAIQTYQSGVIRTPDDAELWHALGIAFNKSGMYREAATAFEKSSDLRRRPWN